MTLGKNEQIVLFVVVFLVIAVAGFFIFLWPEYNKISANRAVFNQRQAQFNSSSEELGLDKFQEKEAEILAAYENGKDVSEAFYSSASENYDVDRLVRSILGDIDLDINNLTINPLRNFPLTLTVFRPEGVVDELSRMAQIGAADDEEGEGEGEGDAAGEPVGEASYDDGDSGILARVPEDINDVDALVGFMTGANRNEVLDFFEENEKTEDVIAAMREFLDDKTQAVLSQTVQFDIMLTDSEAFELSMHIYRLTESTYISSMLIGGDTDASGGRRSRTIEMKFFVVNPLDTPDFNYEEEFVWN
jgi:hypothetical protein